MKPDKIVLVGMMGSGKTTIAKLLAKELNFEFCDLDKLFEEQNNIKIKDFFEKFGEEVFRKKETEILNQNSTKKNIVISTGGGIILSEVNRDILFNSDIFTIYLKASVDTVFDRLKDNKTRPLLFVDNPKAEIEKIIKSRKDYYKKADLTVDTDNKTPNEITQEIVKKING